MHLALVYSDRAPQDSHSYVFGTEKKLMATSRMPMMSEASGTATRFKTRRTVHFCNGVYEELVKNWRVSRHHIIAVLTSLIWGLTWLPLLIAHILA